MGFLICVMRAWANKVTKRYIVQRGTELLGIEGLTTNESQNTTSFQSQRHTDSGGSMA
jgi:hypothetical protein